MTQDTQPRWYGPFDNPIRAVVRCMVAERVKEQEYPECVIFNLMLFPVTDECEIRCYLDDLLQEIGGATGVVIKFENGAWYATKDL